MKKSIAIGLCALGLSGAARAEVLWRGDFETGDTSQWNQHEMVSPDRLRVVTDPVREGKYALEATVVPGDNPIHASGNRNELLHTNDQTDGQERVYKWSTMWPADYASENTWQLFTQFHQYSSGGSPPLEFYVRGEKVMMDANGVVLWTAPLERGKWHDFVFHVKWAVDGWAELYYDGQLVLPKTPAETAYPGQGIYLKQGLYRNASVNVTQHIFHDGMTVATTLADVMEAGAPGGSGTPGSGASGTVTAASPSPDGSGVVSQQQPPLTPGPADQQLNAQPTGGCSSAGALPLFPALVALLLAAVARQLRHRRALAREAVKV